MISMDKRYKTRDGRSVRVLCTDKKCENNMFTVVALIGTLSSEAPFESVEVYRADGSFCSDPKYSEEESPYDLIELPPPIALKDLPVGRTGTVFEAMSGVGVEVGDKVLRTRDYVIVMRDDYPSIYASAYIMVDLDE